jgi:hypothetical protein
VHRHPEAGTRPAAFVALCLLALSACADVPTAIDIRTRVFRVTQADGQVLPAHHPCAAPMAGMVTGARFLEGELTLYPQRAFTWRYSVQQYAFAGENQEAWTVPVHVQGTYALLGDALELTTSSGTVRGGRVSGDAVELVEALPCPYSAEGESPHLAQLDLSEVRSD